MPGPEPSEFCFSTTKSPGEERTKNLLLPSVETPLLTEERGTESTHQETLGESLISEPPSPRLANGKNNIGKVKQAAKSLQSCPTLCNPIDSSPPGSAVPGILQASTLEWVAISFSIA